MKHELTNTETCRSWRRRMIPAGPFLWFTASVALFAVLAGMPSAALAQGVPSVPDSQAPTVSAAPVIASPASAPVVTGGFLRGVIKSGSVPLPGVAVTATNTLTGKKYATTTDVTGTWSMTIPQNGRYVIRTEFSAFAASTHEALLNAASRQQEVNFDLSLASRVAQQDAREASQQGAEASGQTQQVARAIQQLSGNGAQGLTLMNALTEDTDAAAGGSSASGAALPGAAAGTTFSTDSVAITGQSGTVSPLAGVNIDLIREAIQAAQAQGGTGLLGGAGGPGGAGGGLGGAFGGGGFGGGFGGGGFGGGGFGGGRGNFRGFRADQPHGTISWTGGNSALNALPYVLRGQPQTQPDYGSNQFGLTFMGEPYLPKLTKPSGKDTVFFTLSGTRTSTPFEQYALIPIVADNPLLTASQASACTASPDSPACRLLALYPAPNLTGNSNGYNYYYASTAQSNTTQAGLRYMRSLGASAPPPGRGGGGEGRRNQTQNQGLRQSVNGNFNWSDTASDSLNLIPELGGKQASHNYSLQTGYTLGYHRINNSLTLGWNRALSQTTNYFTGKTDIATQVGVLGIDGTPLNMSPLNYGVPDINITGYTGLSETQPSFSTRQTISVTEALSYGHGKHNYRFGGDYRDVHNDVLGSGNATGNFYFTGAETGTSLGDLIANNGQGLPQETSIQAALVKSYLRQKTFDLYAQDDYRALSNLTFSYGIRYEFFSPYSEKNNHLAEIAADEGFVHVGEVYPGCTSTVSQYCGTLPSSLLYPFRKGVAPRFGLALRLPKSTVVRAGYGINFTNGQYATFATALAHQPPFANVQTNEATTSSSTLTLAKGFEVAERLQPPNYALDPHYMLPYVQVWNIDIQKTLPMGIVLNVGYNGSKGSHLDVTSAPRPAVQTNAFGLPNVLFNYEQSTAYSKFGDGSIRLNKRLQKGISMGAYYQYSHSIDDAGSIGGTSTVVAQDWQNLGAEEGNSSIDQRHRLTGQYVYELPFGKDREFFSGGGIASKMLEGLSISGTFTFSTGTPLTPSYNDSVQDVAKGTAGSGRPDRVPGVSITAGGGSLDHWFNTAAFKTPAGEYGTASRNSIPGPGTVSNGMSLSKTAQLGETRSFEFRATASNVFNTVQYAGVNTNYDQINQATGQTTPTLGKVTSAASMRAFTFLGRFRF